MEDKKYTYPQGEDSSVAAEHPSSYGGTSSFTDVMNYLHSLPLSFTTKRSVCRQLQSEVVVENLHYMRQRLKDFANLEKGWDGSGIGIPLAPAVIKLVEKLLDACKPEDLMEWRLFPNVNGTILLEQDEAAISIASKQFSYYAERGETYIDGDALRTTVSALVATIRKINHFMSE